ncbi:MAG: ABC transporter ATP-binding protein [Chloroflexota bacterium]|nr:ABC transporter ATP-binding protein [Chloroflexota bacterium]MDE2910970.1 ABC transporter ATP-binding protein [Chloroflexota bacterium]
MEHSLQADHLTKRYNGQSPAVNDITLRARPGEFLTLLGPSGGGKTTTLRLLAGFEVPTGGRIQIGDHIVADDSRFTPPEKRRVGMVFQDYALFPHVDVAGNIAFGLGGSGKDKQRQVERLLSLVGLTRFAQRMPYELSGGQQQRVALARALAPNPDILLLDEPFSNLDTGLRAQVRSDVRRILLETGTTAVFVTHDQQEALSLSDEIAIIFDGKLAQVATPHALYNRPVNMQVAKFVGDANFLPAEAHGMTAESRLGEVKLFHPKTGLVQLMIRPEALAVGFDDNGKRATVLWREFFGHYQRLGLALADSVELIARTGVDRYFQRGDNVSVSLALPALAYDSESEHVLS